MGLENPPSRRDGRWNANNWYDSAGEMWHFEEHHREISIYTGPPQGFNRRLLFINALQSEDHWIPRGPPKFKHSGMHHDVLLKCVEAPWVRRDIAGVFELIRRLPGGSLVHFDIVIYCTHGKHRSVATGEALNIALLRSRFPMERLHLVHGSKCNWARAECPRAGRCSCCSPDVPRNITDIIDSWGLEWR